MTRDAKTIIAMEYARDIEGEHEMGLRIIGEEFYCRLAAALKQGGYVIVAAPDAAASAKQDTPATDAMRSAAIEAVNGVNIHGADVTPMVGNRQVYVFLTGNVVADIVEAALTAALAAAPSPWQPIEAARRDGTPYLMALKNPIPAHGAHHRAWDGRYVVCQHDGITAEFNRGWRLCGPLGYMGIPDDWFDACMPILPHSKGA